MKKSCITPLLFLFALLFCVDAYAQQTRVVPTKGKDFWVGFIQQIHESATNRIDIFITSNVNTTGTVTIPAQGYSQSFSVVANVTTTVNVPNANAEHFSTETIDNKGIFIQTADTVSVYAINFEQYTADGTLVLPTNSLGTDYRVTSYRGIPDKPLFSACVIVATQANTQIEIIPSVNTLGGKIAGNSYLINLNVGDSYQIKAATDVGDLTGTVIRATATSGSCKPFAVFSGTMCTRIPTGCVACDALFEQEYPTNMWGKNYMITPFSFASNYTYKVLADLNGTNVSINGVPTLSLNAGQSFEANSIAGPIYVTSNNRVAVTQFMEGVACAGAGDPSQLAINPVDQVLKEITFSTVTSAIITQHNVNVIMKSAFISQLRLDGTLVGAGAFVSFAPSPTYSYAQLSLTAGSHTLVADSGFVAYAYGTGSAESYAYALGSFMQETFIPTDTVYCTTSSVTLGAPEILNSPQWTTASNPGVVISTNQNITITPTTNEVYTVTGFSQLSGCPKTYNFSIEIPNPPALTITQSQDTVCQFGTVQLNVSVLPSSSSYIYSWVPTIGLSNPSIANPIATPPQSMWYYCTVSTLNGCGINTDSVFIAVRSGNISGVTATPVQTAFCSGGSSQLNLLIENVVFQDTLNPSYIPSLWTAVTGGTTSNVCGSVSGNAFYFNGVGSRVAATTSLNVINGGTVYFHLKIANGTAPCDNAEAGEDVVLEYSINAGVTWVPFVTYNENLYPSFTSLNAAIPTAAKTVATRFRWRQLSNSGLNQDNWGLDNIYIGAVNNSIASFYWSPATNLTDPNISNPIATPSSTTTYYATVTDTSYGCTYIDSVLIDVGQPFTLNVTNDDTVCQASGLPLYAVPSLPGSYSYSWSPSTTLSSNSIYNPVATPTTTTTYYINTTSAQGCFSQDSVRIYVPLISIFYTSPHRDSICSGQSIQLTTTYQKGCGVNGTVCTGTINNLQIGSAATTTSTNNATIYNGNFLSSRFQLLIRKAELNALGITGATTLKEFGFRIGAIAGSNIYQNFSIKMGCTTNTALTSTFATGLQQVFNPQNVVLTAAINYYVLNNTFDWDGNSNIIVEVCYNNSGTSANSSTYYSNSGFNSFLATSSASACAAVTGTLSMNRPNMYIKYCNSPVLNDLDFLWSPSADLSDSSLSNPIATPPTSTTYYLVGNDSLTGCVYRDSVQITVGSLFALSTIDSIVNCNTLGVPLSATPVQPGVYTYSWSPSGSLSNSTISNPTATPLGTTEYFVSVTSEYGCTVQDSVRIIVPSLATFYSTPPIDSICNGQSVQFNTTYQKNCGTNGSTCPGASTPVQVGAGVTSSASNSITIYKGVFNGSRIQMLFTKVELNAAGITSAKTLKEAGFNISSIVGSNIYQNFSIKMGCTSLTALTSTFQGGLQTVFTPKNVILTVGVNYYVFENTYDWDGVSNVIVEICYNNASVSANSAVFYTTTTNNSVTYTTGSLVCGAATGTIATTRANTYFKYCSAGIGTSLDFQWSPSIGLNFDSIPNPIASPTSNTTYYITATDSSTGCIFNDSIYIKTSQNILLALRNDTTICQGESLTLNAGSGFDTYLWNDGTTDSIHTVSGGSHWVTVSNLCGVQRDTIVVNVNNVLNDLEIGNDTIICNGSQVVLDAYELGYDTYTWQNGSTDSVFAASSTGLYWVSVTNQCGVKNDSMNLIVQTPMPVNLGNDTALCFGETLSLNAGSGYNSYLWQNSSSSATFLVNTSGTYNVTATNACGSYPDTIVVSYNASPTVALGADTVICTGSSVILNANGCVGCNYTWQDGSSGFNYTVTSSGVYYVSATNACGIFTDSIQLMPLGMPAVLLRPDTSFCQGVSIEVSAQNVAGYQYLWQNGSTNNSISVNAAGTYWLTVTNFCGSVADTFNVTTVYPLPGINLGSDTLICGNETIQLNAFNAGYSYLWQDNSTGPQNNVSSPGIYWVIVTDAFNCSSVDSINVEGLPDPFVNLGNDQSICRGDDVRIELPQNGFTYLWQNGSTDYYFVVNDTGIYSVTATNRCGSYTDSVYFSETECICNIDVPTAFSPNEDGANDVLFMRGHCVENINFYVYDRWGNKVFESHDLSQGWDGIFNGKKMDTAVFAFYLSADSSYDKDKKFEKKGNISLIR